MDQEPQQTPTEELASTPAPYLTFRGEPEAQAKLMASWAAARAEFGKVVRDRTGQYGNQRFPYATLGSLTEATGEALAKHGIVVVNIFTTSPVDPAKHRLTTWVMGHGAIVEACLDFAHREVKEAGEYRGEYIKELGKLQTYLIRYQYRALFTLDSEPDADEAPAPERPQAPRRDAPTPEPRQEAKRPPQREAKPAPQATLPPKQPELKPEPPPVPVQGVNSVTVSNDNPLPEPHVELDDGPAPDSIMEVIKGLFQTLGLNRITYSEMVLSVAKVPPSELKKSRRLAQTVMEHMQKLVISGGKGAA